MGFDDLFNKSKKLFADGKDKVTDFVESEKGEQLIERARRCSVTGTSKEKTGHRVRREATVSRSSEGVEPAARPLVVLPLR